MMMNEFEKMGIDEDFNGFYEEQGIKAPNRVQSAVIPKVIESSSFICVAHTGSGKTLAYALPISELIKRIEDENGPTQNSESPLAIIVAPTKELVTQIHQVFKDISHHVKLRTRLMLGGTKRKSLKGQCFEILLATPNALSKALSKNEVTTSQLKWLIFDEADQLFDMGFQKDMQGVLRHVEYDRTSISFFSATLPLEAETFIQEKFAKKQLEVLSLDQGHKLAKRIETYNVFLSPKEKLEMLKVFLSKTAKGRGIVFANQKNQVEEIKDFLLEHLPKLKFRYLHGDLEAKERATQHKSFVDGKAQVLVATDIAARGIDIKDLSWVLNFGLPKTAVYYLHRSGRVGRGSGHGVVYNFVTNYDSKLIGHINDAIKNQGQFDLEFIAKDMASDRRKTQNKKKAAKKKGPAKKKGKKVTKRTLRYG